MTHPLIDRLVEDLGWPRLASAGEIAAFTEAAGWHVLFVPGDPKRNLETADVAVILPELVSAFQGRFDCAVVADAVEADLREATGVLKTPSLIFYREGRFEAGIPKVRDWGEYMQRIGQILDRPLAAAE